jgi:hypothetical protein
MQSGTVVRAVSRRQVFSRHSPAPGDASVSRLRLATEPLHQAAGSINSQLRNCSKQAIGGQGFLHKAVARIKRLPRTYLDLCSRQVADCGLHCRWRAEVPDGWQTVSDGNLSADFPGLRLIVRRSDSYARYVILKRVGHGASCAEVMLSSGTEPNVEAAMVATAKVAARIGVILAERRRTAAHI